MSNELLYENEAEIIVRLRDDDREALKVIYEKHWQALYISAYNILKDKEACEDILQEIFIQLWQRRGTLNIKTSFTAYLFTATRYQVFHHIRKSAGRQELFENLEERFLTDAPDSLLNTKELQQIIQAAVENLPEKCREIYKLSREQHLSYKSIAEQLQISPKTVENQIGIALKKLQDTINRFMVFFL